MAHDASSSLAGSGASHQLRATVRMTVNGVVRELTAPPMQRLADVLRGQLGLTGTKIGCGEGECGACAVLLGGRLVASCLVPVVQADGEIVTTIEGVAHGDTLSAVQRAFLETGGAQCGICTPGMVLAAESLLARNDAPSDADIREALAGNLCRCTGYVRIIEAVAKAALEVAATRAGKPAPGPGDDAAVAAAIVRKGDPGADPRL